MLRAYKYRIYPTPEQEVLINKTIGVCRLVYNLALETKIRAWEAAKISLSAYDLQKQFTQLRHEYDWIKEVGYISAAEAIKNVEAAFKGFFRGGGYPRYKSKRGSGSYCIRKWAISINFDRKELNIGFLKKVRAKISRPFSGSIRQITVSKTATGKYFASILVKDDAEEMKLPKKSKAIGIDLGIKDFAVLSTGEKIANPKYLRQSIERLKVLQRRASKKKKGSNNRKKANLKVALLHEKITNQRNDFLHKVSSKLIGDNQTDTICVETLAVKNMVKNHKLAQDINDVSWGEFVRQLEYKGKWYGKNVIKINKWFASSKTCSDCGHKKDELNLSERTWDCSNCGANHDRDINAAINIRNSGMGSPGVPVELASIEAAEKQETYV